MAPVKTRPGNPPPFNLYIEEPGLPWWAIVAICGFTLGLLGFLWLGLIKPDLAQEEERIRFMGQCVVVKGETEKRCAELWRWRLERPAE